MKRLIGLAAVACLTIVIISSCGDSGSRSGVILLEKSSAFEGYVDKYPDLVVAYSASGTSQSKADWGETHYCNHGLTEGRTYNGLSAASCSSSMTSSGSFEGYVDKYGDLVAAFNASGGGQTKSAWGKNHYCNNGRREGRTYSGLSAASCSSTTTTTTTTSSNAFEGYVNKYADLLAVYNARGGGQTKSTWGKSHYCNHGRNEGRTYSGLSAGSCSSTTTTTTTSTATTPSSITVTSPNGGERWQGAETRNISWTSTNAGDSVNVDLYKSGNYSLGIAQNTANDGAYSWSIPSSMATSSDYKVKITSSGDASVVDESNATFTIIATATATATATVTSTITVTSPSSGTSWNHMSTVSITWTSSLVGSAVNIDLYKYGSYQSSITSSTANDGSYSWTIPYSVPTMGVGAYTIRISDSSNENTYGTSGKLGIDVDLKCRVRVGLSCTDPYDVRENGAKYFDGYTPVNPAVGREVCIQTFWLRTQDEFVCATTGSDGITPDIRISRRYPPVHHGPPQRSNWKGYVGGNHQVTGAYLCRHERPLGIFHLSLGGVGEDNGPCDFN